MKFLRIILLAFVPFYSIAQTSTKGNPDPEPFKKLVSEYLSAHKSEWKLTDAGIENWMISDLYTNKKNGTTYLYVHQQVNGIRIFNAVSSVSVKDGMIKSFARRFHPDAGSKINVQKPANSEVFAIRQAAEHLGLHLTGDPALSSVKKSMNRKYYSAPEISKDKIRVELVYQPVKNNLRLAWDVSINLIDNSHWWNIRVDAVNGEILQKNDWTSHCNFDAPETTSMRSQSIPSANGTSANASSSIPSYRVFPLPLESPNFGSSSLLADPSDAVASPFGWHDNDGIAGAEFTITRGNNVFAYDDISNTDSPGTSPNGTVTLTFDYSTNFSQQPSSYLDASITNLFYVNNMVHDRMYHYGFDEASGNFQDNNYGNGGAGQDYVIAECQDGGGTNNANFSTPDDGQNGRMQMYLWSGNVQAVLSINSPAPINGSYVSVAAGFGPSVTVPITADFVLVDDGTDTTSDACQPLLNGPSLSGKIAVIDRGICNFVDKVLLAQAEGAVAVIMVNNVAGILAMGDNGNGGSVTIPSVMISLADGNLIKNSLASGVVNGTLNPPPAGSVQIDGSLDNGIVVHEYGHGVSTRLTGGPMNSNCLFNGEQGGEGWSDYFALLFTMDAGNAGTDSRGVGTFALGEPANGFGIRRFPYSTDMNINPQTYGDLALSGEVHDIGEIWCMTLWEMTWGLIGQYGFDADWINGTSGNNIALRLVIEGLKLQPCGPGFLDARDAILQADDNLYGGIHKCILWEAFAKRGMGFNAFQGDADLAGDETENFELPPLCLTPVIAPTADFNADITSTCFGTIHFSDLSTDIPQNWNWNFGDGNISTLQNPVHTYLLPGTYSVSLIVSNTIGDDTLVRNSYITVTKINGPAITGDTVICSGTNTILTSTPVPGNETEWHDAGDSVVSTSPVFVSPALNAPATYYAFQYTPTPLQHVGPPDNNFGTGGYHNTGFEGKLLFTVLAPMKLKSVWVDAGSAGIRTVNVYGSPGNVLLHSVQVNLPAGTGRVPLDLDFPSTGNYQIGVAAGSDLYRNNDGASFPYTVGGLVSITTSNSTTNPATFYYYLYDWEVQALPCLSAPVPVNISIDQDPTAGFTFIATGLNLQFTDTTIGNPVSFSWSFGNGDVSSLENPSVTYTSPGTYTVSLTVTSANGCQSTFAQIITVTDVGIYLPAENIFHAFYSGDELTIKFNDNPLEAKIKIYDPIGKLIYKTTFNDGKVFKTRLENVEPGFILVIVEEGDRFYSKKIILAN